ncbi:unnamed protein product [Linum tenue]|uniref:Alpha/beta-Hydrolases superfamily protein n=1 Tax=Linum tenue TaxID=586396 RepID=A0AAV0QE65_9ROSI|nr:unnamed protein product [Linum tenue]
MGDLCIDGEVETTKIQEEIVEIPSVQDRHTFHDYQPLLGHECQSEHVDCHDAQGKRIFRSGSIGPRSSEDDIFTSLLRLSSYISHRLICFIGFDTTHSHLAESLILRDVVAEFSDNLFTSNPEPDSSFPNPGICKSCVRGCSSSFSNYRMADKCTGTSCRRTSQARDGLHVNARYDVVDTSYSHQHICLIIKGLMIPLFGFRLAWRLAFPSLRYFFRCIRRSQLRVRSVASRVYKTLHGSSDDIGWLQNTPGMPPVSDGTPRFLELLENIRNGEHVLPDSFVYLLIPGLFSNHGPLYFVATKRFFSKMGLACHIAKIHSEASVEHNALELKQYIDELYWGSGKRVMLLGHSKGGVDAAAALSIYWSDLKDKVAGLAFVQSPYGGTPIASDILREGQIADRETRRIMEFLICKLIKGDIRALEDLTYDKRREFIMNHHLPDEIPLVSFHSEASIAPGVLATMTQIAHAELPWLPLPSYASGESDDLVQVSRQVPVVMPISGAMALCALHLQLRYGEKSDGLVTCRDAEVPGSVVVRPDRKLDHGWMVYSSKKKDPSDPDSFQMCEALLTMLVELGKSKQKGKAVT